VSFKTSKTETFGKEAQKKKKKSEPENNDKARFRSHFLFRFGDLLNLKDRNL